MPAMPVDNDLYQRQGNLWWDDREAFALLRSAFNPARFGYFCQVLREKLRLDPLGLRALDIGYGGGLLAEEFARLGCHVTGLDPAEPALAAARAHAQTSGLSIDYRLGVGEQLPFENASFNLVYCCDVLEHVDDLERVITETARVLKPGGVYCFDTINRTLLSNLVTIKLLQAWKTTRILPPNLHDWHHYITPRELRRLLARDGLAVQEMRGLNLASSPFSLIAALRRFKRGALTYKQLGEAARFRVGGPMLISYIGYALKL
jgi:2-polyprenyl-6-hydroxyphenyl methylase/3-demethylubiquinone-9 3-methyltransferase